MTPYFYQYQIITLFHFQVGGWIAFLRGDAGQAGSSRMMRGVVVIPDRVRQVDTFKLPLLPLHPPSPVTSLAPCHFQVLGAVSHRHRAVRSWTGRMLD